ncbi:unnamed protein product [Euphydryas editha]|uniref:Uncharacterized protein n=1 Tax=Euphydryas editha TaxID=104508 RepID=A0AAU9TUC2_EUPED|nr:unnamed protein product [Euphydryas editha]
MKTNILCEAASVDIGKGTKKRRKPRNFNVDLPLFYPEGQELSNDKIKDHERRRRTNIKTDLEGGNLTDDIDVLVPL